MSRGRLRQLLSALAAVTAAGASFVASAQATPIPPTVENRTNQESVTISFSTTPFQSPYSPTPVAISRAGTNPANVTWEGAFASHPLRFETLDVAGNGSGATTTRQLRSGRYAYYCNVHGGSGGSGMSGEVYVAGPRAELKSTPADVAPGGTVTLDASATDIVSFVPASATYAFDPEGDGTFLPAGGAKSMQATYPAAGTFAARVRVTDEGRVDEASFDVGVAAPGTTPPPGPSDPPGDGPLGSTSPTGTPGPAGTKAPSKRAVRFTDVATLPKFGRCVNRRRGVRISVRDGAGADVRSVRVLVDGRTARSRSSVRKRATLNIRPLPRGRPLVKVVVTLAGGKRLSRSTRYRTCA